MAAPGEFFCARYAFSRPKFLREPPIIIVVCDSLVPAPLQTPEPIASPTGPALKNEMMLPAVLDLGAGGGSAECCKLD
jgi:hypothetical protein